MALLKKTAKKRREGTLIETEVITVGCRFGILNISYSQIDRVICTIIDRVQERNSLKEGHYKKLYSGYPIYMPMPFYLQLFSSSFNHMVYVSLSHNIHC